MAFYFALFNVTSVNLKERAQRIDYTRMRTKRQAKGSTSTAAKPRRCQLDYEARMAEEENRANEEKAAIRHFLQSAPSHKSGFDGIASNQRALSQFSGTTAVTAEPMREQEQPNITRKQSKKKFMLLEKVNVYEMVVSWWKVTRKKLSKDSIPKTARQNKATTTGSCKAQKGDSSWQGKSNGRLETETCRSALLEIGWVILDECRKVQTEPLNRKFCGSESKRSYNWHSYKNYAFQMVP